MHMSDSLSFVALSGVGWPVLALLLITGVFAGLLAGLLGVGGGIVLVPSFLVALDAWGYRGDQAMQLAVGTSLATIVVTSLRSVQAHWKRGAVDVPLLKQLVLPVAFGALAGMALAQVLPSKHLMALFGILGSCVGLWMAIGPSVARAGAKLPRVPVLWGLSSLFGGLSALMGIGGGSFFVPMLSWFGRTTHQAVATSAGVGVLIALPAVVGFAMVPVPEGAPPGMMGQVNLIVAVLISLTTVVSAPLGAELAHRLNAALLKRIFGVFLVVTAVRMLLKAMAALV